MKRNNLIKKLGIGAVVGILSTLPNSSINTLYAAEANKPYCNDLNVGNV